MKAWMQLIVHAATLIVVIQAWLMVIRNRVARRCQPRATYGPMIIRDRERIKNLNYIYNSNDTEALWMLRMSRAPFNRLVRTYQEQGLLQDSIHTNVDEQVDMFLHVVGHNQRFKLMHNTFRRSMETISRYFKQVLYAIGELRGEMINPPTVQTPSKIRGSQIWYPYFKVSTDNM